MAPASAKTRNDATGSKNPAFGGAYRLPGCVAMLARCDSIALRTAPDREADTPHQIVSIWSERALDISTANLQPSIDGCFLRATW